MFNCLLVGAGNKACLSDAPGTGNEHKYLSYCHAIKDNPNFAISEIYDINAEATALAYNIWGDGNGKHIDIGIVASSDDSHYNALKSLATMDVKLVIAEKPLCNTVAQAREIVELYRRKGIPLMVDYTRRFIPRWRAIKDDIDEGLYGRFIKGYCYFNRGWEHTASHFIDQTLWYNGNLDNIEIHEVESTYQWVYQWGLFYENNFASEHAVNIRYSKVDTIYDNHLKYLMQNALNFLQGNEPLFCTGEDALKALEETMRIKGVANAYSIDRI
jgi:predicted dehydrogenase